MYFPDDIWYIIKEYQGFKKYYLIPSRKLSLINEGDALVHAIHEKMFQRLLKFLYDRQSDALSVRIVRIFDFLMNYMHWLDECRKISTIWDRFVYAVAGQCQDFLSTIECRCGECDECYTYNCIEYISRLFYTKYVRHLRE